MSILINEGGPAFPFGIPEGAHKSHGAFTQRGMSLRDWLAGQAIMSANTLENSSPTGSRGEPSYKGIATRAYFIADAMLIAREAKQ